MWKMIWKMVSKMWKKKGNNSCATCRDADENGNCVSEMNRDKWDAVEGGVVLCSTVNPDDKCFVHDRKGTIINVVVPPQIQTPENERNHEIRTAKEDFITLLVGIIMVGIGILAVILMPSPASEWAKTHSGYGVTHEITMAFVALLYIFGGALGAISILRLVGSLLLLLISNSLSWVKKQLVTPVKG
jgi:hypothetical protein